VSLDWTTLSDGELATLSIAGRQAAFAEIVRRYQQPVFRLARACVGEPDEALDLVQETFVAAHQALPRYDGQRAMKAWLSTIAINKCRDWARKRAVRRFFSFAVPIDRRAEAVVDDQVAVDDGAADRQELDRVTGAISTLPMNLKEALVLRTIEGLSQAETAEVLGISQKAVETRLYRARSRLLEKLSAEQGMGVRDA
jgi:RNA polymerase sigma factor (sigma-70 family)